MVLEDDVFFNSNLIDQLRNIYVPEYDLLYLGGITSKKNYLIIIGLIPIKQILWVLMLIYYLHQFMML